jgi:dTDP-4-amino-4,6-dideoxygalactose transaminase
VDVTIPISAVRLGEEEERLVLEVLRSGRLAQGPMVERLESRFAALCGVRHAVAVSSGTTALVAALQALQLEPGDEVVTSPFTFVATLNAILEAGAVARFADIDPTTFTVDPVLVEKEIGGRTRVVMPVHLYGQPADMTRLMGLAEQHGLAVVEDAAQAHGARHAGRAVGSFGIGCFSFYATKNVTTGEGGIVTTKEAGVADRLRLLRNQGMRQRYRYEIAGHNYRLTDLQAALALPQLDRLGELNAMRRRNALLLSEALADLPGVIVPETGPAAEPVFHQFTIRVTADARLDRDRLAAHLLARGIASGVYYPKLVFDYPCYRDHPGVIGSDVPEATRAASEVLSLPVHDGLSAPDVGRVAEAVREALG